MAEEDTQEEPDTGSIAPAARLSRFVAHTYTFNNHHLCSSSSNQSIGGGAPRTRKSSSSRLPATTPQRVTRSRSQTPALQEEHEVSRLALPLDVLSEDEEEEAEATVRQPILRAPSSPSAIDKLSEEEGGPFLSGKDRGRVLSALFLLFLLAGLVSFLAGRLHSGEGGDRIVIALAYTLAPLRALVEAARLVTAREGLVLPREPDYDLLAAKIVDSARFQELVERLSGEKVASLSLSFQEHLAQERQSWDQSLIDVKDGHVNLHRELVLTKDTLKEELARAKDDMLLMGAATKNVEEKGHSLVINESIKTLDNQISEVKASLAALQASSKTKGDSSAVSAELSELQARLSRLELSGKEGSIAVQKCCGDGAALEAQVKAQVEKMLTAEDSPLRAKIVSEMADRDQVEQAINKAKQEVSLTLEEAVKKLQEDTKAENVNLVNVQFAHLKSRLAREIEANLTSHLSSLAPVSSTPSISSSQEVAKIVREALTKYDADKTGLFDFALESAGGSIVTTKCTEPYQATSAVMSVWGLPFWWDANSPRTILQPGSAPGQCWAFRGSYGTVVVKLSSPIFISAVTIEHISPLLSPDGHIHSAPHTLSLSGVGSGDSLTSLLNFTYSASGEPVQTFWLGKESQRSRFETVELTVHKNHGHPEYTCLYRLRVHGSVRQGGSGLH